MLKPIEWILNLLFKAQMLAIYLLWGKIHFNTEVVIYTNDMANIRQIKLKPINGIWRDDEKQEARFASNKDLWFKLSGIFIKPTLVYMGELTAMPIRRGN